MGWRTTAERGFTVAELLIVIVIIGILSILVMNTFGGSQARARDAVRSDDAHMLVGQLIAYSTIHNGLPRPQSYSGADYGVYDTSAQGDWLPFLASSTTGKIPKDPLNNGVGDPMAASGQYTYFYTCFKHGVDPGAPSATNDVARIGYRVEHAGAVKTTDFNVEACQ